MSRKAAAILFLIVCAVLAGLLLAGYIAPRAGGIVFAAALVILGILSGGFRKS